MRETAYGSTLTFNPACAATYRSASPSGMLSSVTVIRAPDGPDTTGTGATPGDPPGAPWAGAPAGGPCAGAPATGGPGPVGGGCTGSEGWGVCPGGESRGARLSPWREGH